MKTVTYCLTCLAALLAFVALMMLAFWGVAVWVDSGDLLFSFLGFGFTQIDQRLSEPEHGIDNFTSYDSGNRGLTGDNTVIPERLNYFRLGVSGLYEFVCCFLWGHFKRYLDIIWIGLCTSALC